MTTREFLREARLDSDANVAFLSVGQFLETEKMGMLIAALLNCGGGVLVCGAGLSDDEEQIDVIGVGLSPEEERDAERAILLAFAPAAPVFLQEVTVEGKRVLSVDVPPGKDPPYASGNVIYALHEGRPVPATNEEIREWVLNSSSETNRWENRAAFANALDAIEETAIERAAREANDSKRKLLDVNAGVKHLLSDFQVLRDGRLLNAGLVLFGRAQHRWLPQTQVRFAHFAGQAADADILYSYLYDGPICDTINTLRDYIVEHAPQVQVFDSLTGNRHQELAYPVMPVREALVNAFVHRDYESALGGVTVSLFSDRVEIANSGKLPEGVTVKALNAGKGAPSRLVNPLIANNLYFRGYMEQKGRGSAMIKGECQKVGTKVVWSIETPGWIKVTLTAHTASPFIAGGINQSLNGNNDSALNLVELQENALKDEKTSRLYDLLMEHPFAKGPELQELTGMSRGELQGVLDKMKAVRLIVRMGSKKTGGYYVTRLKEIDFDYKMIVRHCFEAEHTSEHRVHGGYQPEKVRLLLKKLCKDGLILCEPDETTDSLNHFDFLGFTEKGRALFLENGQIKGTYHV